MRVVTLVPYRSDGGRRDELWRFVEDRWAEDHPDWPVHLGVHTEGPFNRSRALNTAAADAGAWDVAVILDADALIDAEQVAGAARKAYALDAFVIAYTRYNYVNRRMSDRIMNGGYQDSWWSGVEWSMTNTCSTCVCVARPLWDRVGGFDEGFIGWGWEDCAFSASCSALGSRHRVPGEIWHLWHPPSTENDRNSPDWQRGLERLNRYTACQEDPARISSLLAELGVTDTVTA